MDALKTEKKEWHAPVVTKLAIEDTMQNCGSGIIAEDMDMFE